MSTPVVTGETRTLSLPAQVEAAGGIAKWNCATPEDECLWKTVDKMCQATTVEEALVEVKAIKSLGHYLWAYSYMRCLYNKNMEVYYGALLAAPGELLPIVYTPTVGEACQKFGKMPFYSRGCYVKITDRGNFVKVLEEYAAAHLQKGEDGKYMVDCIVFSDGGRILGLGDLGAWGMGIPIGKLDLYTVCAGVDPYKTIPVIIDAGIFDSMGNTAKIDIRDDYRYTGLKQDRVTHTSEAGTRVNSAYYGEGNMIQEFLEAATSLFGEGCLCQFEDFNSNDAFPLLAEWRDKFLTYNDDIQGTASIAVAGVMGAIKLKNPAETDLISKLSQETFLFHGAGSANLGGAMLLSNEGGVPMKQIFITNSRGVIWKSEDEKQGTFRNAEQKAVATCPEPDYPHKSLVDIIANVKPTVMVGAVGVAPNCFDKSVCEKMMEVNCDDGDQHRPVIFALSNPKTQAEVTAENCYNWTGGEAIFGSGTQFDAVTVKGKTHCPGQVNNVYIFPGTSFAAVQCQAKSIPERIFLVAAEAVANSLDEKDVQEDRVVPNPNRIRDVSLNVATAVVMECQKLGLARKPLGDTREAVMAALKEKMWSPKA